MSFSKYEAYKYSGVEWLGEVPEDWDIMALKYVTSMKGRIGFRGYTTEDIVDEGDGAITLSPSNMINGQLDFSNAAYISWEKYYESPEIQLSLGDTVIVKTGSTYGRVAFVQDLPMEATVNPQIAIFKTELVDKKFLFFLVSSKYFYALARNSNTGSTMPTMTQESVLSFSIALPSRNEQIQIARFLDHETARIDALIAEQEGLIELLKEKRQAVISHAVTKGLDPSVPMKDSGVEWLGEVPEHWTCPALKYVCELLKDGTHLPPPRVDDGVPLLSVRNIVSGKFIKRDDDSNISYEDYKELCRSFIPQEKDVLLATVGATLGKTAMVKADTGEFHIQRSLAIFRTKTSKMQPEWLHLIFQSTNFQNLLWENVGFSAQPGIYLGALAAFCIPLPSLDEQENIVSQVKKAVRPIDELLKEAELSCQLIQERRSALISAAVTGKIDVRSWQAPPSPTLEVAHG